MGLGQEMYKICLGYPGISKIKKLLKANKWKIPHRWGYVTGKQESTEIAPEGKVGTIWATQKISSVGL